MELTNPLYEIHKILYIITIYINTMRLINLYPKFNVKNNHHPKITYET